MKISHKYLLVPGALIAFLAAFPVQTFSQAFVLGKNPSFTALNLRNKKALDDVLLEVRYLFTWSKLHDSSQPHTEQRTILVGRNNIYSRNVAITDTGGDLALNGKNDYAYTAGIPQALADALEKYHDDDDYIDDVQLTEDGEWLILVGKNGCQWSNIPSKLESKLRQWNEAEETITSITFNDDGDWIAVSTDHVASSSTDMDDWIKEGIETHGQLWAAHLTNDACVLCFENGYKFLGNVPQKLKDALKATKYDVYRIKFTKEGSYFFADQEGHYTFWM